MGSCAGYSVVALIGGVTAVEVPAPVNWPTPRRRTTRNEVDVVVPPARIRHLVTVPLTGEVTPPGAA